MRLLQGLGPSATDPHRRLDRASVAASGFAAGVVMMIFVGCGSRGPLEDSPIAEEATLDAEADAAIVDAGPKVSPKDARPEAGAVACGTCVIGTCGEQILSCLSSAGCVQVFQCVATQCLAGGTNLNPACLLQCAGTDPGGALTVVGILQCVTVQCGADCAPVLSGLGGASRDAGGGRDAGVRDGGQGFARIGSPNGDRAGYAQIFSPWPPLASAFNPP